MLGTDCGSLSSTGVCNQKEESGAASRLLALGRLRKRQADDRVLVYSMSGAPSVGIPETTGTDLPQHCVLLPHGDRTPKAPSAENRDCSTC